MRPAAYPLLLIAAIAAAYANAIEAAFQFDDWNVIVGDPRVQSVDAWWHALPGIRPVLKLSYALNHEAGGGTRGFHAFNVAIHAANVLFVFALAGRLARARGVEARSFPLAVAAVFALHPVQTEAVAYASGRSVSLSALFALASALAWMLGRERGRAFWVHAVSPLLFACAVATKETAIVLPAAPRFTGYALDGGYAEYCVADERFCLPIPEALLDAEAAPLLCAGLIGYRSLVKAGAARRLGIYGFGAAAHIVTQVARFQGREIYAFTRRGDGETQQFALSLGAAWAGDSDKLPPERLDAAIIFAPAGELVPSALKAVAKGGTVVCGCIHMSDIPAFPYELLWQERSLCSLAEKFLYRAAMNRLPQIKEYVEESIAAKLNGKQIQPMGMKTIRSFPKSGNS